MDARGTHVVMDGAAWAASTEPNIEPNAFPDEDCVQVTRQPSQTESSRFQLPLTPQICGRLGASPLFVQMRRFVPGADGAPFPWGNSPSRTIVYGIATPRVDSLELTGAGNARALAVDRRGGAFMAVFPIASTTRETLRAADPSGGPEWMLRSWQGSVKGVGNERFRCAQLGVIRHGQLVEPSATPSTHSRPLTIEGGRCNPAKDLIRMRYMLALESFLDDPYQYTPHPERTVLSGMLPPGASDPVLLGVGPARALPVDANNAFLVVLGGRYWNARPRISYVLHSKRIGGIPGGPGPRRYQQGTETPLPQVRAPDPDGAAPWGFVATRNCRTAVGRIVAGRLAHIDLWNGVLEAGSAFSGSSSSCATHPDALEPAAELREPVEFNEQQVGTGEDPLQPERAPLRQPEIEWRTLPGRTIVTGVARPDVASVTLSTPSDVRTLQPAGPLHAVLAVYDGYFLRGNLTATVQLRDGRVQTEQIPGYGPGAYEPEPLTTRLREAKQTLAQLRARARSRRGSHEQNFVAPMQARVREIERRVAYDRTHPGLLPAE
jgi:hypothetical protein